MIARRILQRALRFDSDPVPGGATRRSSILKITEADVQRGVIQLLKVHPRVAWAHRMNTGAGKLAQPDGSEGRFVRFAFKGCSDILGQLKDGRFLAVECKSPTGAVTDDQAAFLSLVNKHGGLGFVARSADDVQTYLDEKRANEWT